MYRPLPDYLTIMPSKIEGLGLFAIKPIEKNTIIGITHLTDAVTKKIFRTPLGGFINHSKTPNAKLNDVQRFKYLYTIQDIQPLQEITLFYTMYNPENNFGSFDN